ncbi:beta-lactamase [Kribbella flavida DSM 17836]|uniref:Beta-lactamase n=1 Tax=Kribbella flavida (strain DSM 17836 / JCM 10339 / NBRC 14399) TaxID=479435 RepID=D2PRA9_KRIFD|nr:serine hydrolase domain-containing protein [Kribbella flavida]ADB33057.1 beta-lactamase [Kribbella flavida DSM 17836]
MTDTHGDGTLAVEVRELLGDRHPVVVAATLSPDGTRLAGLSADLDADFELGSISKGITGLLYVDALDRGEITPSTTLGELLPLASAPAAAVTLESITTHRSGLPRLPASAAPLRRSVSLWTTGANPYGETLDQLIGQTRGVRLQRPKARYSNLGFELLGHAIASAAGMTYADLLHQRIAVPLGLDVFYVPATPDELRPGAVIGTSRSGRARRPWTGEAVGPAGGIRASIRAMAQLTAALLDGSAPGVTALDPVARFSGPVRIGAAWITLDRLGRLITWHNGGTGGFRTWIGLDRAAGTGVVLLSATSLSVDRHGFELLARLTGQAAAAHRCEPGER